MYVVDLDNSLVATDLLYETFFAYFSREPISALRAFLEVKNGGAALKARLADRANLDVSRLPYNPDVLAFGVLAARLPSFPPPISAWLMR